jgi:hypothetical protein
VGGLDASNHRAEGDSQSTAGLCHGTDSAKEQTQNSGGEDTSATHLPFGATGSTNTGEGCANGDGSTTKTNDKGASARSQGVRDEIVVSRRYSPTCDPWQTSSAEAQRVTRTHFPSDNGERNAE